MSHGLINKPRDTDGAFSEHFQLVYSSSCPGTFPYMNQSMQVLSLAPISHSGVHTAIKRLGPTESVGLDGYKGLL
jgi:hypothetical protein